MDLKPGQREWKKGDRGAGAEGDESPSMHDGRPHTVPGSWVGETACGAEQLSFLSQICVQVLIS